MSLELGRPSNPCDTERYVLNKEFFHCSARFVLALELPTQDHVAALVINFADAFRGKPMSYGVKSCLGCIVWSGASACILVVSDCRQLIILRHAESFEISNCPPFDDAGEYRNQQESDNKTFRMIDTRAWHGFAAGGMGRKNVRRLGSPRPAKPPGLGRSFADQRRIAISVGSFFQLFDNPRHPLQPKIVRTASPGLCAFIASISYV
jgi:hypothetical protein